MTRLLLVLLFAAVVYAQDKTDRCQNGGVWNSDSLSCKCKAGFSGKWCHIHITCCTIWGDPHYLTYDGARISFQGSCKYHLTHWCPCVVGSPRHKTDGVIPDFSVRGKNYRKGSNKKVSWLRYVEATVNGTEITLDADRMVLINGAKVAIPYNFGSNKIGFSGDYVRVDTAEGASIQFDGKARLIICVPTIWNELCGICGNNNGKKEDDYKTKDGTDLLRSYKNRGTVIGNSWEVHGEDDDCETEVHQDAARASHAWTQKVKTKEYCGLIRSTSGPYKECIKHLGNDKINAFYENCQYDVYENAHDPDAAKTSACGALEALEAECEEIGFRVVKWRGEARCAKKCPPKMVYGYDISACPATCADPKAPEKCTRPNIEGCRCSGNALQDGDDCIYMKSCGCTEKDGTYHKTYDRWFSKDCKTRYVCKQKKSGELPSIVAMPGCKDYETCKAVNGEMKCVRKPVDGKWSHWSKWSECTKFTCDDYKVKIRTRRCDRPAPRYGGKCHGEAFEVQPCIGEE